MAKGLTIEVSEYRVLLLNNISFLLIKKKKRVVVLELGGCAQEEVQHAILVKNTKRCRRR